MKLVMSPNEGVKPRIRDDVKLLVTVKKDFGGLSSENVANYYV